MYLHHSAIAAHTLIPLQGGPKVITDQSYKVHVVTFLNSIKHSTKLKCDFSNSW